MVRPIGRIVSSCFLVSLWKGFGGVHGKTCALFHALDFSDEWQGEKETKMAVMQFRCPYCGQIVEGDESYRGKVAECPFCAKKIIVDQIKTVVSDREGVFLKYCLVCCLRCNNVYVEWFLKWFGSSSRMCHCNKCGYVFDLENGTHSYQRHYKRVVNDLRVEIAEIDGEIAAIDIKLQAVGFFVQEWLFEEDWKLWCEYQNPLVIERLKFQIEKLRTRLSGLNMEKIVNAQRSAQASGMMYGTTVGLRDPQSGFAGLCRSVVQMKASFDYMKNRKAEEALYGSTTNMEEALARCEALMDSYYELRLEFEGKQKDVARRQRLMARCGFSDRSALTIVDLNLPSSWNIETLSAMASHLNTEKESLITKRSNLTKKIDSDNNTKMIENVIENVIATVICICVGLFLMIVVLLLLVDFVRA